MMQELINELEKAIQDSIEEVHTAFPGVIVSIDYDNGTADVKPIVMKYLRNGDVIEYPLITEVPILLPQGAGQDSFIAFPVKAGDGCLLIVSEQSLDFWQFGMDTEMNMPFDMSNAVCIPGLFRKMPAGLKEANRSGSIIIKSGKTVLKIGPNGAVLNGDLTVQGNVNADNIKPDEE